MTSKITFLVSLTILTALASPLCAQTATDDLQTLRKQIAEMQRKAQIEREQSDAQINLLLTAQYTFARRRTEDFVRQNNLQRGNLLRLQAQFNY